MFTARSARRASADYPLFLFRRCPLPVARIPPDMIFERSLQRELAYTAGAVFLVLLTIMLSTMLIRIVGFAASGEIDPRDVLVLIGLTVVGYLAVMLIVTMFVSILFVLTRWYRDSEMVVWFASGVSHTRLIRPIAKFSAPLILLIMFFAFV